MEEASDSGTSAEAHTGDPYVVQEPTSLSSRPLSSGGIHYPSFRFGPSPPKKSDTQQVHSRSLASHDSPVDHTLASNDRNNPLAVSETNIEPQPLKANSPPAVALTPQPQSRTSTDQHDFNNAAAETPPKVAVAFAKCAALNINFDGVRPELQTCHPPPSTTSGDQVPQSQGLPGSTISKDSETGATRQTETKDTGEEARNGVARVDETAADQNVVRSSSKNAANKKRKTCAQHEAIPTVHPSNRDMGSVDGLSNRFRRPVSTHIAEKVAKKGTLTSHGLPTIDEAWNILKFAQNQERVQFEKAAEGQRAALQEELCTLRNKNTHLESQCIQTSSELTESHNKVQDLIKLNASLKNDLSAATAINSEHEKALERETLKSAKLEESFQIEKTTMNDQISELTRLLKDEKAFSASLEQKLVVVLDKVVSVEQGISHIYDHSQGLAAINTTFNSLHNTTKNSLQQLHELILAVQGRSAASSEAIEHLASRVDVVLSRFEDGLAVLQSEGSSTSELEKSVAAHVQSLKADLIQMQNLQSQLLESQKAVTKLQERNSVKDQEILDARQQLTRVVGERQCLEQNLIHAEQQLALSNSSKGSEIEILQAELHAEREKLKPLSADSEAFRSKLQEMEEVLAERDAVVAQLSAERLESEQKTQRAVLDVRTMMTKQAAKLLQAQEVEYENKLHLANRKRHEAEEAMRAAQLQSKSAESDTQKLAELEKALDEIRSEHQLTMDHLMQSHKAELQAVENSHNQRTGQQIETAMRDLEISNQTIGELRLRLTNAEEVRDQALRNEEQAKRDTISRETAERSTSELVEQHRKLRLETEQEVLQLRQSYDEKVRLVEERALKAEADLERFRHNTQNQREKLSVRFEHDIPGSDHINRQRNDDETNAVTEPKNSGVQFLPASGDSSKENVDPRLRTLAEINNMFTSNGRLNDGSPSSSLSDLMSISTQDLRALHDSQVDNTPSQIRIDNGSTRAQVHSLSSLFQERPASRSQALANSASRRGPSSLTTIPSTVAMPTERMEIARREVNRLTESYSLLSTRATEVPQFESQFTGIGALEDCSQGFEINRQPASKSQESSSSPDFIADSLDSQNVTKYKCHQLAQPRAESILENNESAGGKRKRPNTTEQSDKIYSQKPKFRKDAASSAQTVLGDQSAECSQNVALEKLSRSTRRRPQQLPARRDSQVPSFKSSQPQAQPEASEPLSTVPQTSQMSTRVRSSHGNSRGRNRRPAGAKSTRKNDRYKKCFDQELKRN